MFDKIVNKILILRYFKVYIKNKNEHFNVIVHSYEKNVNIKKNLNSQFYIYAKIIYSIHKIFLNWLQ